MVHVRVREDDGVELRERPHLAQVQVRRRLVVVREVHAAVDEDLRVLRLQEMAGASDLAVAASFVIEATIGT